MRISVLSDSNWEAKLDHATRTLMLREYFEARSYGQGLSGISIILCARDPGLNHQRRERFTKVDRTLRFDVMLSLEALVEASHQRRRDIVCDEILGDLERTLARRKFVGFDATSFMKDFAQVIREDLQGKDASRFDHLCLERASGY